MTAADPAAQWQRMVLLETLRLAVPLHITELAERPVEQLLAMAARDAETVGTHGDDLQYGGKHCAPAFNALARGLAIAALTAWGGVTWHGLHWCRTPGCANPGDVDAHPQPYPDAVKPPAPRRPVESLPDLATWEPPAA